MLLLTPSSVVHGETTTRRPTALRGGGAAWDDAALGHDDNNSATTTLLASSSSRLVDHVVNQEEDDYDDYKAKNDDWWMDPLAMFEDDDDDALDELDDSMMLPDDDDDAWEAAATNEAPMDDPWDSNNNDAFSLPEEDDSAPPPPVPRVDPHMSPLYKRVEHEFGLDQVGEGPEEVETAPPPRPLPPPAATNLTPLEAGESTPPVAATAPDEQWKAAAPPKLLPWGSRSSPPEAKRGRLPWLGGGGKRNNNKRNNNNKQHFHEPLPGVPLKAAGASLLSLVPRLGSFLTGSPATAALVVITLGKALSFYHHTLPAVADADTTAEDHGPPARTSSYKPKKADKGESEADAASGRPQDAKTTDPEGRGWLGALRLVHNNSGGERRIRLPRSRVLHEALEDMKVRCAQAEEDKASMEQAYEKTNWELQETKSELTSLKTTTRHLQSQITDNGELLDKTIRTERRRAKEELVRMKHAMVQVVEKERAAMKSEFVKQAAELQALWRREEAYDDDDQHGGGSSSHVRA
jgi:hypothetical protein